jgi:tRNA(Arg) A34 adenosine deaminase TadA
MKPRRQHGAWSRRRVMRWGALCYGAASIFPTQIAVAVEPGIIPQPSEPTPKALVNRAFEMRDLALTNRDQGYGALIINSASHKIVGQSPSRVIKNGDPTAHAEMEAFRDAARRLGTRDLSNHVMYSSSRPCPMCEAAAYWANIGAMYFGRGAENSGPPKLCRSG